MLLLLNAAGGSSADVDDDDDKVGLTTEPSLPAIRLLLLPILHRGWFCGLLRTSNLGRKGYVECSLPERDAESKGLEVLVDDDLSR